MQGPSLSPKAALGKDPTGAEPPPDPGARVVYRAEIEARLDEVARVCSEVGVLAAGRFGEPCAGEIDLGLTEALSNIVRHGYPGGQRHGVALRLSCSELADRWVLRVFDQGQPISKALLLAASATVFDFDPTDLAALPEGGMGLVLMQASFDEVDYRVGAHGNLLVLTKYIGRQGAGRP